MNDNKVAISATINNSVLNALREQGARLDRSVSWLLNNAAEEWLARQATTTAESNTDRAQLAALK
jgi:hypothetical protein